ncbi:MAG: TlpA family protein disulfide reductase [FCB group bacterium]|nr:TlpA family protein disulfide reductase [FCB group bacterium]
MKLSLSLMVFLGVFIFNGCGQGQKEESAANEPLALATKAKSIRPSGAVKAPDFTLATVEGDWVTLKSLRGKVVLLNFWGTWCPPCRKEIPDFVKLYDKYNEDGLEIVGITLTSGSPSDIKKFMEEYNMNYIVLTDIKGNETQMVTQSYGKATGRPINGIPTTFIIDREGYIVKSYIGPRTEEVFYNDLKPYLYP